MQFVNSAFNQRLEENDVGKIIELVALEGRGFSLFFTTANQEVFATLSGSLREYKPLPGEATGTIQSATDLTVATMRFLMASSADALMNTKINANQMDGARVTIERVFADTPDLGRMLVYVGFIGDITWSRAGIQGQGRNVFDSHQTQWPYNTYGDGCVWRFGSPGCGVDTSSYTVLVSGSQFVVGSSSRIGLWVTNVVSLGDDYYSFGRVTFTQGANSGQVRTIRNHIGNALLLSHTLPFQPVTGDVFTIFPGCRKRRVADCTSKFNNSSGFNGYWTIPIPEDIQIGQ